MYIFGPKGPTKTVTELSFAGATQHSSALGGNPPLEKNYNTKRTTLLFKGSCRIAEKKQNIKLEPLGFFFFLFLSRN